MERFFELNGTNTYVDLDCILTAKSVDPPEPKTNLVELDGMDGSLDLSEALTGEITYENRTVNASFWRDSGSFKDRSAFLNDVVAMFHGRKIQIVEPDDLDHYFYGRVSIGATKNILPYCEFSISAVCDPWRYARAETTRRVDISGETDVVINNGGVKTLCPLITVNGNITMIYGDMKSELSSGQYQLPKLKLKRGTNIIRASGDGSVLFTYREATL